MQNLPNLKKILFSPREFFESVATDENYLRPWLTYFVAYMAFMLIFLIIVMGFQIMINPKEVFGALPFILVGLIPHAANAAVMPFIIAAMIHLGAMIFGAKGGFIQTFKVASYSGLVQFFDSLVFGGIISVLLFLAKFTLDATSFGVWPIYVVLIVLLGFAIHLLTVQTIGVALYHNISKKRAFFGIIIIPLILSTPIILLIVLIAGLQFFQSIIL